MINSAASFNDDPIPYVSFADECYMRIRNQILNGVLDWGERVDVVSLAEAFRVSRSPVVKAIDRLAREGLIAIIPNKGSYVYVPTEPDVIEVIEVRIAIEMMACELATRKNSAQLLQALDENEQAIHVYRESPDAIPFDVFRTYDRRFHQTFALLADNRRLLEIFEINRNQIELARTKTYVPATMSQALQMHRAIIEELRRDKIGQAQLRLREHIEQVREDMIASVRATSALKR